VKHVKPIYLKDCCLVYSPKKKKINNVPLDL
jgi:hypothetical protein